MSLDILLALKYSSKKEEMFTLANKRLSEFNEEKFNRHIKKDGNTAEILKLTKQAYNDFAEYYDQGVIIAPTYKEEYELAKKAMQLDSMYNTLISRLELFAQHESAHESIESTKIVIFLTLLVGALGLIELGATLFSSNKIGALIFYLFILVAFAIFVISSIVWKVRVK
ncbi:MAG: hypothetical protein M1556_01365 [Candidatus Thermoplasmatota archaeon]|nr:hypothetical protein [Candidatus Thermoplasmatota archaeon]MCL6002284.1 hypothetical protein [Candidatus Thermoplasmatota archaeon]